MCRKPKRRKILLQITISLLRETTQCLAAWYFSIKIKYINKIDFSFRGSGEKYLFVMAIPNPSMLDAQTTSYSEKGMCSCRRHVPPQLAHDFSKAKAGKAHILAFSFGHKTRRKEEEGDVANACLSDFSSMIP